MYDFKQFIDHLVIKPETVGGREQLQPHLQKTPMEAHFCHVHVNVDDFESES